MEYRLDELARALDCQILHGSDCIITAAGSLHRAGPGELVYASTPAAFQEAAASGAGCIVVDRDYGAAGKAGVLLAGDPREAFLRCLGLFYRRVPLAKGVSPSAEVAPDAVLAPDAAVGPWSTVGAGCRVGAGSELAERVSLGPGVILGAGCRLHPGVVIGAGCVLGDRVEIHANTVIGSDGFGFNTTEAGPVRIPQTGRVEIGSDVEIGACCTVDRATAGATVIGAGSKLDNLVHIAHNVVLGKRVVIAAQTGIAGSTVVGDGVLFGGQVGVADHCRIGDRAVFGAQAGAIPGKFAGDTMYWGTPAREIGEVRRMIAWLRRMARKTGKQ